jgi:hypothetical protein
MGGNDKSNIFVLKFSSAQLHSLVIALAFSETPASAASTICIFGTELSK